MTLLGLLPSWAWAIVALLAIDALLVWAYHCAVVRDRRMREDQRRRGRLIAWSGSVRRAP